VDADLSLEVTAPSLGGGAENDGHENAGHVSGV